MMTIEQLHNKLSHQLFQAVLESCGLYNGSVTSFGRTVKRNEALEGSPTSWHLDWLAIDVILDSIRDCGLFISHLQNKGFRVLPIGSEIPNSGHNRSFHVQYDWPVIKDFERKDPLSHLQEMVVRFPHLFRELEGVELA